jgi:hypothetical protein
LVHGVDEHLMEVVVLGLAIHLGGIHPIVNRIEVRVFASAVYQADHTNSPEHAVLIATVLRPYQLDEAGIPFIVHAIIHN